MKDRDRLIELLKQVYFDFSEECVACCEDGYKAIPMLEDFFADYLLANGVIVPPCKFGDKVYRTDGVRIYESTINEITYTANNVIYGTEKIYFDKTAIGKTVFLTKEQAEEKLKELG